MSVLQRSFFSGRTLCNNKVKYISRGVVINPAINNNPAYNFKSVLPIGFSISDDLRSLMVERGLDSEIDFFERTFAEQVCNDAEFNHCRLPGNEESRLWGFVYGTKLVEAQLQLDELTTHTEFMGNYLQNQISELTVKMARYYPNLDWKSQVNTNKNKRKLYAQTNANFRLAYHEAFCDILLEAKQANQETETILEQYLKCFANNYFVNNNNNEEPFASDFLPTTIEDKMIQYFQFEWYLNCENNDASLYFNNIRRIEDSISIAVNALSKELRDNLGMYFLESIGTNPTDADYVVKVVERSVPSVVDDTSSKSATDLVNEVLVMLGVPLETKMSEPMSKMISRLFFGNTSSSERLFSEPVNSATDILQSVDISRLSLIHKTLQIQECLKHNSLARLLVAVLLSECSEWMTMLVAIDENSNGFTTENTLRFDDVVSKLNEFYVVQKVFASKMMHLSATLNEIVGADFSNTYFDSFNSLSSSPSQSQSQSQCPCFIANMYQNASDRCKEGGDIVGQVKYSGYCEYFNRFGNDLSWYKLLRFVISPSRNGFSSDTINKVAFSFVNNSTNSSDLLFDNIVNNLYNGGSKSDLIAAVKTPLDEFKASAKEFETARAKFESACEELNFNFDQTLDFEQVKGTYDPLAIHLSQFRYLSPK